MSSEITHEVQDGRLVQVVSPSVLRRILRRDGESLARPKDFGPNDEWNVGRTGK